MEEPHQYLYEFGPFRLDTRERVLLRDGRPVPLKPKVYETLLALISQSGHVVDKEDLMRAVWPDVVVEENNLTGNIFALRRMFAEYQYIETVPRRGYRFTADVKLVKIQDVTVTDCSGAETEVLIKESFTTKRQPIDSLAVLPFINASADPETEYLSDGITESIINNLTQLSPLRVMARNTVFRYKGTEANAQAVGRELKVGAVLLGRVLLFGDQLVIRAELVDTSDGSQLWGEQYNRPPADLLAIQEAVAKEITEKLRLKLTDKERGLLTKRYTENTEAYHLYLKGRFYANMRTPHDLNRGLEYFQQAIAIDPLYAPAYSGMADCYLNMGYMFGRVPPTESLPKAKAAALRALEIDDTLAEAYASLAFVTFNFDWEMASAKKLFEKSFEMNPNYPTAHHWYGAYLSALGRHDEAIAEARKALELDPLSLPINHFVAYLQLMARRPDDAMTQFRKTLELNPGHPLVHHNMGTAFEYQGRYEEAVEEFLRGNVFVSQSEGDVNELRRAFKDAGWKGFLQKHQALCLAQWERDGPWHGNAYYIASNYARLGDRENALDWLERTCEMRSGLLIWLSVHFHFDVLRQDPRFTDLLRRVGLAESNDVSTTTR